MPNLKKAWKDTGKGLGGAFKGLGKTLINSTKKGADKAVEWAGRDNSAQPEAQTIETTAADAALKEELGAAQETSADAPAPSVADEIRKLAQLKDEGILTEEEFAAKKKQLLGL